MITYYMPSAEVRGEAVPVGAVMLNRGEAERAAQDINLALPPLRVTVLEVPAASLNEQPETVRAHVRQFIQTQA